MDISQLINAVEIPNSIDMQQLYVSLETIYFAIIIFLFMLLPEEGMVAKIPRLSKFLFMLLIALSIILFYMGRPEQLRYYYLLSFAVLTVYGISKKYLHKTLKAPE